MAACLLITGFGFWAPEGPTRIGIVATGIYVSRACFRDSSRILTFRSYSWYSTRRVKVLCRLRIPRRHSRCIFVIWECRGLLQFVGCSSESPSISNLERYS